LSESLPLGGRHDPYGVPDCGRVHDLARRGDLIEAAGPPPLTVAIGADVALPSLMRTVRAPVRVSRGDVYEIWLRGSLRSRVELVVDGEPAGEVRHQLNNRGQYVQLGSTALDRGRHRIELRFGGADLHPGSAGDAGIVGPLALSAADPASARLVRVPAAAAGRLCGRRWDWIEVAG
jgi:hypothetical protein